MDKCFRIISPVYNSQDWIKKCIDSVKAQTYSNYEHIIVDDGSTDKTLEIAIEETRGDPRFKVVKKDYRMGIMHSHITGAELQGRDADDEDIYVHLDGDDWLSHDKVLERLNTVYNETGCWMTYGNYEATDGSKSVCASRREDLPIRIQIVKGGWCFSHLRTFKKFLWDKIRVDSLLDSNGKMFTSAADVAILCPMLEMAGDKVSFIDEVLYIYNRENPLNEDKDHLDDQIRCALEVLHKPEYQPL